MCICCNLATLSWFINIQWKLLNVTTEKTKQTSKQHFYHLNCVQLHCVMPKCWLKYMFKTIIILKSLLTKNVKIVRYIFKIANWIWFKFTVFFFKKKPFLKMCLFSCICSLCVPAINSSRPIQTAKPCVWLSGVGKEVLLVLCLFLLLKCYSHNKRDCSCLNFVITQAHCK